MFLKKKNVFKETQRPQNCFQLCHELNFAVLNHQIEVFAISFLFELLFLTGLDQVIFILFNTYVYKFIRSHISQFR